MPFRARRIEERRLRSDIDQRWRRSFEAERITPGSAQALSQYSVGEDSCYVSRETNPRPSVRRLRPARLWAVHQRQFDCMLEGKLLGPLRLGANASADHRRTNQQCGGPFLRNRETGFICFTFAEKRNPGTLSDAAASRSTAHTLECLLRGMKFARQRQSRAVFRCSGLFVAELFDSAAQQIMGLERRRLLNFGI